MTDQPMIDGCHNLTPEEHGFLSMHEPRPQTQPTTIDGRTVEPVNLTGDLL